MNILLVGEESAGIHALRLLANSCHRVVGVLASPRPKYGSAVTLWNTAQKLCYRTWVAENVKDPAFAQQIQRDQVDLLLNVHSLHVINSEVLRAPRIGSFNLHPAPLPRYAGRNPVCWALYFGETTHGVTLHRMTAEIDAGPIIYQSIFPVSEEDTGFTVSLRCIKEGLLLFSRLLAALEASPLNLPETPQDTAKRQYLSRNVPHQGQVIWSLTARQVLNFVRACNFSPFLSPWGVPRARRGKCVFGIVGATRTGSPTNAQPGTVGCVDEFGIRVACCDEWITVGKVKLEGKLTDATRLLHTGDLLEPGESDEHMDSKRIRHRISPFEVLEDSKIA
jgi:methionyl-tRNA formyltransferase